MVWLVVDGLPHLVVLRGALREEKQLALVDPGDRLVAVIILQNVRFVLPVGVVRWRVVLLLVLADRQAITLVNRHVCATAAVAGPEQVTLIGFSMNISSLMEVVSARIFQQRS